MSFDISFLKAIIIFDPKFKSKAFTPLFYFKFINVSFNYTQFLPPFLTNLYGTDTEFNYPFDNSC